PRGSLRNNLDKFPGPDHTRTKLLEGDWGFADYKFVAVFAGHPSRRGSVRPLDSRFKENTEMLHRRLAVAFLILAIAQGVSFAQSQANTGIIEGMVVDPSGSAIGGAQVAITNIGTNFTRNLTTDSEGRFRGLLLPLGAYRVTVKAANFGTLVREGLDLAVGQTITLTLALTLSQVEQVVAVTAEAPILETGRVENSTYLDQRS